MRYFLPSLLAFLPLISVQADVTLPPIISDHMVLAHPKAAIWGKADPGEEVTVRLGNAVASTKADGEGKWRVELEGLTPGESGEMTIAGKNTLTVRDVLVGEVWVASGQSNMTWQLQRLDDGKEEIAKANHPGIRMFNIRYSPTAKSDLPVDEISGKWAVCEPSAVENWSSTGYFFARHLHKQLQRPVGIIHTSHGGTPIQAWTPKEVIEADPEVASQVFGEWDRIVAAYPKAKEEYDRKLEAWKAAADTAKAEGKKAPNKPRAPITPDSPKAPTVLYNTMVHGIVSYTIDGFIWYQGEANAPRADLYRRQLPALMKTWRERWNTPDAPFYIVQLANYRARTPEPGPSDWAELRDAQREAALADHASGLAVTIDIGDAGNIHPTNKQEVGRRLALLALEKTYGKPVVSSGPIYQSASFREGAAYLTFRSGSAKGMRAAEGEVLAGFTLAGEDRVFHHAEATIADDGGIVVKSAAVPEPVAVRYGWASNPEVNLVNEANLPASPFRSDSWPQ